MDCNYPLIVPCSQLRSTGFRACSAWADRESLVSFKGRTFTFIQLTVQPLLVGSFIYGLVTVIQLQRIALLPLHTKRARCPSLYIQSGQDFGVSSDIRLSSVEPSNAARTTIQKMQVDSAFLMPSQRARHLSDNCIQQKTVDAESKGTAPVR